MKWLLKDKFIKATWAIRNKNISVLQKHAFMALEHGSEKEIVSFFEELKTSFYDQYEKIISEIVINYLGECLEDGVFSIDEFSNVEQILKLANCENLSIYKTSTFQVTELVTDIIREFLIDEILDEKEAETINALCKSFKMSESDVEQLFLMARLAIIDRNNFRGLNDLQNSDLRLIFHIPTSRQFDLRPLRKGEYVNIWTKSYKDRVYFYQAGVGGRGKIGWLPIEQCSTLYSRLIESEHKGLYKHYIYDASVTNFNDSVTVVQVDLYSDSTIKDSIERDRIAQLTELNNSLKTPYLLRKGRNIEFELNDDFNKDDFKVSLLNRQQYLANPDTIEIHLINSNRHITGVSKEVNSKVLPVIRSIYSGQKLKITVSEQSLSSIRLCFEPILQ